MPRTGFVWGEGRSTLRPYVYHQHYRGEWRSVRNICPNKFLLFEDAPLPLQAHRPPKEGSSGACFPLSPRCEERGERCAIRGCSDGEKRRWLRRQGLKSQLQSASQPRQTPFVRRGCPRVDNRGVGMVMKGEQESKERLCSRPQVSFYGVKGLPAAESCGTCSRRRSCRACLRWSACV